MSKEAKGQTSVYKFYKIDEKKIEKLKRECPRCGRGIFMADHKDRYTCGKCSYTEFKKDPLKKQRSK